MSRLGQQMFFARKRSANVAAAAPMLVTKALSQDVMVLAFVPLFADPQGVAQPPLQSTNIHDICFYKCHPQLLMMSKKKPLLKQQKALKGQVNCPSRLLLLYYFDKAGFFIVPFFA
ncbi:hypothetical protein [Lysinibacillus xylanilyticus]|uniref:hypothetical protein n=1 Tax=Lysinibacillus xylanilyticus TaxID=582475 RepID=UPI0038103714